MDSFCVIVDVLGFVNLIEESRCNGTAQKLLENFDFALRKASHLWGDGMVHYKFFTDNIIFGGPLTERDFDTESEFGAVSMTASFYQLEMALQGFFVRGGMSFGPLHMSPELAFGQACVDAHNLETKESIYPRIIINQEVMHRVYQQLISYARIEDSPQSTCILVDEDHCFFLNYLIHLVDADEVDIHELETHRDFLYENLSNPKYDLRILEKYEWLAMYHNYFIENYAGPVLKVFGDDPSPLKIRGYPDRRCRTLGEFVCGDWALGNKYSFLV